MEPVAGIGWHRAGDDRAGAAACARTRSAPQQRCVTAADYADQATQFGAPGPRRIQRAVASIRWTGSWFVVVRRRRPGRQRDRGPDFLAEVTDYLDDFRMAGHDLQVVPAEYAALDVGLAVQLDDSYRRDLVRADLLELMSNRRLPDGRLGLFHPDRLTFGTTVYLGPILAAAQATPGGDPRGGDPVLAPPAAGHRCSRHGPDRDRAERDRPASNDPSRPELGRFYLDSLVGGR